MHATLSQEKTKKQQTTTKPKSQQQTPKTKKENKDLRFPHESVFTGKVLDLTERTAKLLKIKTQTAAGVHVSQALS